MAIVDSLRVVSVYLRNFCYEGLGGLVIFYKGLRIFLLMGGSSLSYFCDTGNMAVDIVMFRGFYLVTLLIDGRFFIRS